MFNELQDRQCGFIPLTEAGVEGSPEELCILTPVNRGSTFNIIQKDDKLEQYLKNIL